MGNDDNDGDDVVGNDDTDDDVVVGNDGPMMVMMCGNTDFDNHNDGTDDKVSDEADADSIFFS